MVENSEVSNSKIQRLQINSIKDDRNLNIIIYFPTKEMCQDVLACSMAALYGTTKKDFSIVKWGEKNVALYFQGDAKNPHQQLTIGYYEAGVFMMFHTRLVKEKRDTGIVRKVLNRLKIDTTLAKKRGFDISDISWVENRNEAFGFSYMYPSTWRGLEYPYYFSRTSRYGGLLVGIEEVFEVRAPFKYDQWESKIDGRSNAILKKVVESYRTFQPRLPLQPGSDAPFGWQFYSSQVTKDLPTWPADISFYTPKDFEVKPEAGAITLSSNHGNISNIVITYVNKSLAVGVERQCANYLETKYGKGANIFYNHKIKIDDGFAAYIKLNVGIRNYVIACVPEGNVTYLVTTKGSDSEIEANYFNEILTAMNISYKGKFPDDYRSNDPTSVITDNLGQMFTDTKNRYILFFPTSWNRVSKENNGVETFFPGLKPTINGCSLKVTEGGLLGRDISLKRGPDQEIYLHGLRVTKHTWLRSDGSIGYFNFEVPTAGALVGIEGSVGTDPVNCAQVLDNMVDGILFY